MSNKRLSNSSQQQQQQKKPSFNDQPTVIPTKEDDKKSVNGSQINDSQDGAQKQQQSKFDLPQIPKFQSLPLRDYFDNNLSAILLEGLKEVGRQRPENPIRFLGEYLLEQDKQK
ncbi:unnamed protein product [Paramecium pentaurelia]|uniref:Uncharacterized protein n=1 Tax=Paramecium pentaurelia TaxID=43138 RepID=A0A8S1UE03_9CILI|nr:unnamed protein product [Paramecium pentaurelia]